MALSELITLEDDLKDLFLEVLRNDSDIIDTIGSEDYIHITPMREYVPFHFDDLAIQIKDGRILFNSGDRSKYHEKPVIYTQIFCYKSLLIEKEGSSLTGTNQNTGLMKLVWLVIACLKKEENLTKFQNKGFYWVMPFDVVDSDPLNPAEDTDDKATYLCKTITIESRKMIGVQ